MISSYRSGSSNLWVSVTCTIKTPQTPTIQVNSVLSSQLASWVAFAMVLRQLLIWSIYEQNLASSMTMYTCLFHYMHMASEAFLALPLHLLCCSTNGSAFASGSFRKCGKMTSNFTWYMMKSRIAMWLTKWLLKDQSTLRLETWSATIFLHWVHTTNSHGSLLGSQGNGRLLWGIRTTVLVPLSLGAFQFNRAWSSRRGFVNSSLPSATLSLVSLYTNQPL